MVECGLDVSIDRVAGDAYQKIVVGQVAVVVVLCIKSVRKALDCC